MILSVKQYQLESTAWQRMLDFFRQENAILKNRLSEMVDGKEDKNFIPVAEQFQNEFLMKDEYFDELKKDIADLQKQLKVSANDADQRIFRKHNKLKNEIRRLEKNFLDLKSRFNNLTAGEN